MTRHSLAWCVGIAMAAVLLVALLHAPLASVEDQFTTLKYHVRGSQPADTNIVIVYIDNEAIRTLGWPVRRNFYALMINTLAALQVKAVGVEIQFEDARLGYPEYPEYDDLLASVIASSKNVVLASYFDVVGEGPDTAALNAAVPPQLNFPRVNGSLPEGKGLHLPLSRFLEGAAGVGHVNFTGASGVDIPVLVHRGSGVVPAFAAEVLRLYCGAERSGLAYSDGNVELQAGTREIRLFTSSNAAVQLNLPNSFNAYTRYPFLEVLRAYDALRMDKPPSIPAMKLKDKLVLIGVVAEGRSEFRSTPVDPRFPSIGLHALRVEIAQRALEAGCTLGPDEIIITNTKGFTGHAMGAGIEEVVAPLGTALTEMQASLLRRYTRNVFLLYDSDGPGLKATFRSGDELLRQGFSVRVVTLPAGEDPDSFVRAHGAAALETELGNAIDVFERKIQILERAGWFGELQKKRRALDRLLPTIRATSDPIMRDLYLSRAAEVTGVDRAILLVEAGTPAAGPGRPVQRQQSAPRINPEIRTRRGDRRTRALMRGASAERELIRAMLTQRSRVDTIAERIGPDSFRDDRYRAIFSALLSAGDAATIDEIAPMLGAEEIEIVESLLEDPTALVNPDRTIDDSLAKLEVRDMEDRLADIDRLLPLARDEEKEMLDEERQKIVLQMRASGKMSFKAFRRGRAR